MSCPCCSGQPYEECCKIFHNGILAPDGLTLMRSRYTAFALHLVDYIIRTTHPQNEKKNLPEELWRNEIALFCEHTQFTQLKILSFCEMDHHGVVSFVAHFSQNGQKLCQKENSYFEKVGEEWLYVKALYLKVQAG